MSEGVNWAAILKGAAVVAGLLGVGVGQEFRVESTAGECKLALDAIGVQHEREVEHWREERDYWRENIHLIALGESEE